MDLLTYADLESLRQRKTGNVPKSSNPPGKTVSLNSKRYLIVTYTVEFDRIHYPLPLPYMGKPDPRALQETIRQQRAEIKALRQQVVIFTFMIFSSPNPNGHVCYSHHFALLSTFHTLINSFEATLLFIVRLTFINVQNKILKNPIFKSAIFFSRCLLIYDIYEL